jgi:hypothetical protein
MLVMASFVTRDVTKPEHTQIYEHRDASKEPPLLVPNVVSSDNVSRAV